MLQESMKRHGREQQAPDIHESSQYSHTQKGAHATETSDLAVQP